jgi:hypothetical protein
MGTSHVFILRIWQETDHAHPHHDPALRGSLQLVSTGEVRYFSRMEHFQRDHDGGQWSRLAATGNP